jgi:hypothetical protein
MAWNLLYHRLVQLKNNIFIAPHYKKIQGGKYGSTRQNHCGR